jgi:hypothetical protein
MRTSGASWQGERSRVTSPTGRIGRPESGRGSSGAVRIGLMIGPKGCPVGRPRLTSHDGWPFLTAGTQRCGLSPGSLKSPAVSLPPSTSPLPSDSLRQVFDRLCLNRSDLARLSIPTRRSCGAPPPTPFALRVCYHAGILAIFIWMVSPHTAKLNLEPRLVRQTLRPFTA